VLNKAITANPQSTDLRLRKAAVNIELEQWDYAIEEYGRVLGIDANNLPALYYRAFAHNHQRHYDMARADYERFLQLLPRHFEARLGLAMTLRRQGKTRDVADELNRLVQMFPDSAVAYAVRADFEQEQAQYDLALYDWDEALRLANGRQEYQLGKYGVLWAMRRYEEARRLGEQLLEAGVPNATLKQLQVDGRKKK
jgi:tetratricopeptide (TPR) repeat protein